MENPLNCEQQTAIPPVWLAAQCAAALQNTTCDLDELPTCKNMTFHRSTAEAQKAAAPTGNAGTGP